MRHRPRQRVALTFIALLIAGVLARSFGAWCFRHATSGDYAIPLIMAKHMAEGRDFPVFYYGQTYMGSLEPAFSALLVRLFGCTPFVICLGTALISSFLVPLAFLLGRSAAGTRAGLSAALLCLVGPAAYFYYTVSPHGGYAVALVLGTLILWLAARIAIAERSLYRPEDGGRSGTLPFIVLGLAGGIGWWTTQVVVPTLITAALVIALAMRLRVWRGRVIAAAAAFVVGAMPWWIWNMQHGWEGLNFTRALGATPFLEGLKLFFGLSFLRLNEMEMLPRALNLAGLAVLLLVTLAGLAPSLRRLAGRRLADRDIYVLSGGLMIALSALLAARTQFVHYAAARYLLPLWPALAMLAGTAGEVLRRRFTASVAWLPVLLLLLWQSPVIPDALRECKRFDAAWPNAANLVREAKARNIEALYAHSQNAWLHFATGEWPPITDFEWERYAPYERAVAEAKRYAVLENYGDIQSFFAAAGGTSKTTSVSGYRLDYELTAPPPLREIDPRAWSRVTDNTGAALLDAFLERNYDHCWRMDRTGGLRNRFLEIELRSPTPVAGVRIWSGDGQYPPGVSLEGKPAGFDAWEVLLPPSPNLMFFWSGPRLYWNGLFYRQEWRFAERSLTAIRIRFINPPNLRVADVSVVQLLASIPPAPPEEAALPELLDLLAQRQTQELYADRWVSEQVFLQKGRGIKTHVAGLFTREVDELAPKKYPECPELRLSPAVALLTRAEDADLLRAGLQDRLIAMRETPVGPWRLFDFGPGDWRERYAAELALYWTGNACLNAETKHSAWAYYQGARGLLDEQHDADKRGQPPPPSACRAALELALRRYPNLEPAARDLEDLLRQNGDEAEAAAVGARRKESTVPPAPARVAFPNGMELLGVGADRTELHAGESFHMRYFWRCATNASYDIHDVFVHFQGQAQRFQDDHAFMQDLPRAWLHYQPWPEVFVEDRLVKVPGDIRPGDYDLRMGMVDPGKGTRLAPQTELPSRKRRVSIPMVVRVTP